MPAIVRVDPRTDFFRIHRDLRVSVGEHRPGPPERIDGFTAGLVTMAADAPHGGEVHPDGDEILVIIDGRVQVTGDSAPDEPLELGPGEACIVRAGEWHTVHLLEPTRLLHITPGPNGDHRPQL
jgi:mannose-6-phosphate isomerase-like protein (cupin superfamily)